MYGPLDEEMNEEMDDELGEEWDEEFHDEADAKEMDVCFLRALQSAPPGEFVSEENMMAWISWVKSYQKQRAIIEVVKSGLVDVIIVDGEPGFRLREGDPHPSVEEIKEMRARQREEEG